MNETQRLLEDMVARLLADGVDPTVLAEAERGRWPEALWRLAETQGLTQPLLPGERGGMGATWHDAFVIVRAAGRRCAPIPLAETIVAGWLLAAVGLEVPAGPLSLAGAHPEDRLHLAPAGAGWRLSGAARRVPWGRVAGSVVLALRHQGDTLVVRAPSEGCAIEGGTNLAGEWRDTLVFRDQPVEAAPWARTLMDDLVQVVGAMARSAQMAGALAAVLERSVAHAKDRHQFGRPIGKHQAVQQNLAVLAAEVAAAQVAAEAAFLAADQGDPSFLASAAKARAGLAVSQAVGLAHQVHGAIGFALEHPLQWATRRLLSWRTEFGGDRQWAVILGQRILDVGADGFWPHLATRSAPPIPEACQAQT